MDPRRVLRRALPRPGRGRRRSSRRPAGSARLIPQSWRRHFLHLEIRELLGQGGMGAVYKARHRRLDRMVALKILPSEISADPAFAERFTREARALASLNHPHIVTLYDFGEAGGLYYLLMEFVDGLNLRRMMAGGKLEPREALAIVPQVCDALQYAHDEGIVHRDIKPENILLDKKGRVKIADFGLAKLMNRGDKLAGRAEFTLTGSQQVMGTPHYMAPEQMERPQGVDHRADIFSLGVVFYEMLTGELPLGRFAAPSYKAQIDVRLDEVVLRSLEKEPDRRYQHASAVKTDVERISCLDPMHSPAEPFLGSDLDYMPSKRRAAPILSSALGRGAVVLTIALFIGIVLIGLYMRRSEPRVPPPVTPAPAIAVPWPVQAPAPMQQRGWVMGPSGPVLTDEFTRSVLTLEPHQIVRVNKILQSIHAESQALEARHTDRQVDDAGHIIVTVKPYPGPLAKLEDRLWTELDGVLSPAQQSVARLNLYLDRPGLMVRKEGWTNAELVRSNFFGWGKGGARIEVWRVGTWYHWSVQANLPANPENPFPGAGITTVVDTGSAPEPPKEYRRFWNESPKDGTAPEALPDDSGLLRK